MRAEGTEPLEGSGAITFRWEPTPRVRFSFQNHGSRYLPHVGHSTLNLLDAKKILRGDVTQVGWTSVREPGLGQATGRIVEDETANDEQALGQLIFHLPNFHNYMGAPVRDPGATSSWAARAVLNFGDWRVTLDGLHRARKQFEETLIDVGGYGLTHVGLLERTDGAEFSSTSASDTLRMLFDFFSFCRGMWCAPQLPVGLDKSRRRTWERWEAHRTDRWQSVRTWFSDHARGIEATIAGFSQRYTSERWGDPLRLANYWYVEANTGAGGVEGSIILVQAAFELLAWTLLVEEKKLLSEDGFQKLPAMDKIRILLAACKIPLELPPELPHLGAMARAFSYQDGPQAFTEFRNGLVHPNPDKRARILTNRTPELCEASFLGLWYLELVLLWLCNFNERYSCRLVSGVFRTEALRLVPWAPEDAN